MESNLLKELQGFRDLTSGKQREFFEEMLSGAKEVKCTPLSEIFTKAEIARIRSVVKPKVKECYRNAHLMMLYFPGVEYVEGKVQMDCGLGIEHAFNRIGDRYFDITWELVLHNSVEDVPYLSIGEYTADEVNAITVETGYYGDIFRNQYIKKHHGKESSNQ